MKNTDISSHAELLSHILLLKEEKLRQEEALRHTFREFTHSLNPVSILKNSLHELANNKEVKTDFAKAGLKLGADFIIDRVLGRHRSIGGFLSAVLAEAVSGSFINNNISKILSGIGKLMHRQPEENDQR